VWKEAKEREGTEEMVDSLDKMDQGYEAAGGDFDHDLMLALYAGPPRCNFRLLLAITTVNTCA
jgi:hypothetical protein